MARLRDGDPEAANELLALFEQSLVRYFRVHLPDAEAAEDAAQEVFVRLLVSLRKGRYSDVANMHALVFTIARRLAIDSRRAWGRRPVHVSLDEPVATNHEPGSATVADFAADTAPNPRRKAEAAERLDQVTAAMRKLDPVTREVIILRQVEGIPAREVAKMLNLAEGTVWSRLHRGLAELQKLIETDDSNCGGGQTDGR